MDHYKLGKPILVIGFYHRTGEFWCYPNLFYINISFAFKSINPRDLEFKILSITPDAVIRGENNNYIASPTSVIPGPLQNHKLTFFNSSDKHIDHSWVLGGIHEPLLLNTLKEERIPWRYEDLDWVVENLALVCKHYPEKGTELRDRILKAKEEFGEY